MNVLLVREAHQQKSPLVAIAVAASGSQQVSVLQVKSAISGHANANPLSRSKLTLDIHPSLDR
ncbi:hypothetical protein KUV51_19090 [Tateyamaria omphalii]|uniref:hypothetical protein n=1 Tax=Tateyamaria omphalii TaxID=299262 RepID=UPI001C999B72|nr:hypothetical protein [Tateyamaria omphalii]MBY5935119.1 hypothetical protein [Tateyamaria omphalii]